MRYPGYNFNSFQFGSIVFVIFFIAVYNTFWGLRLNGTGIGGDSLAYIQIAMKGLIQVIEEQSLSGYHEKRFLPAICVYLLSYFFNIERSVPNIVILSSCLNLSALVGTLIFWLKLCKHEKISSKASLLGIILLFANFLNLIFYFFQPVITDAFILFLAISSLYFYRCQKYFYLTLVSVLLALTWPLGLYMNILFFLFKPDHRRIADVSLEFKTAGIDRTSRIFLMICIFSYIILYLYFNLKNITIPFGGTQVIMELLPLSMAFNFLYIFIVLTCIAPITSVFQTSVDILKNLSVSRYVFLFSFLTLVIVIFYIISGHITNDPLITSHVPLLPQVAPFWTISAYVMAMGILPVLFIYYIYEIFEWAERDRALWITVILGSIFFLNTETRHSIFFFPYLVFILCKVIDLDTRNLNPMKIYLIFFVNFLVLALSPPEALHEWYVKQHGPWMTHIQYIYGLCWAILSGCLVYTLFSPSKLIYKSRKVFRTFRSFMQKEIS